METQLTIEHLAAYLPYGLNVRLSSEGRFNLDGEYVNEHANKIGPIRSYGVYQVNGKFEVSGEFYVTEKYSFDFDSISEIEILLRPLSQLTEVIEYGGERFVPMEVLQRDFPQAAFYYRQQTDADNLPYCIMRQLLMWHVDIFDLIESGLAEPIPSIPQP
jgi:hypothetical protein